MSRRKKEHQVPVVAVMTPVCPVRKVLHAGALETYEEAFRLEEPRLDEMTEQSREMVEDAYSTVRTQQKKHAKLRKALGRNTVLPEVRHQVYFLGSRDERFSITALAERLILHGSNLLISCHGNPTRIGMLGADGISPEQLAELLSYVFAERVTQLKCITLVTCNAGYYEVSPDQSYVARFHSAMCELGATELTAVGAYGYVSECSKGKHTYVSQKLGGERGRMVRFEQAQLTVLPDGSFVLPEIRLRLVCSLEDTTDVVYERLATSLARSRVGAESSPGSASEVGLFAGRVPAAVVASESKPVSTESKVDGEARVEESVCSPVSAGTPCF